LIAKSTIVFVTYKIEVVALLSHFITATMLRKLSILTNTIIQ